MANKENKEKKVLQSISNNRMILKDDLKTSRLSAVRKQSQNFLQKPLSVLPTIIDQKEEEHEVCTNESFKSYLGKIETLEDENQSLKTALNEKDKIIQELNQKLKSFETNEPNKIKDAIGYDQEKDSSLIDQNHLIKTLEEKLKISKLQLETERRNRMLLENKIKELEDVSKCKKTLLQLKMNHLERVGQVEVKKCEYKLKNQFEKDVNQIKKEAEEKLAEFKSTYESINLIVNSEVESNKRTKEKLSQLKTKLLDLENISKRVDKKKANNSYQDSEATSLITPQSLHKTFNTICLESLSNSPPPLMAKSFLDDDESDLCSKKRKLE